jgi:Tol biopolymer transport system component
LGQNGTPAGEEVIAGSLSEAAESPDWSPNGNRLVYACRRMKPSVQDEDICLAPVAAPHTESKVVTGPNDDVFPAFSPSGGKIVWDSGPENSDTELKVKNLSTGNVSTLTSNGVVDQEPDWGVG